MVSFVGFCLIFPDLVVFAESLYFYVNFDEFAALWWVLLDFVEFEIADFCLVLVRFVEFAEFCCFLRLLLILQSVVSFLEFRCCLLMFLFFFVC